MDRKRIPMLLAMMFWMAVGSADAEGSPVVIGMDHAVQSRYQWRGFTLDDSPVLQQGVRAGISGFTAGIWGSFGVGTGPADADEVDYTLDYTRSLGPVNLSLGYIVYDFPSADLYTREFYAGLSAVHFLSPRLTWYHDHGDEEKGGGTGDYLEGALEVLTPLGTGPVTWSVRAVAGYNRHLFIEGEGLDVTLGTGFTWAVTEKVTINPGVAVTLPFGDLEDPADGGQTRETVVGIKLAFAS